MLNIFPPRGGLRGVPFSSHRGKPPSFLRLAVPHNDQTTVPLPPHSRHLEPLSSSKAATARSYHNKFLVISSPLVSAKMVKPLRFKGDPKPKKRKRVDPSIKFGDNTTADATEDNQVTITSQPVDNEADAEDSSWVSAEISADLAGPIIFILPTTPVTCLACDQNGSVFASVIENIIDDDPRTAEPHDVRQVWVVSKVAGTENYSFKGHHGKYLSCDKLGILSAEREAVSPLEQFLAFPTPETPGTFQMQTLRDTYITTAPSKKKDGVPEIRSDATEVGFDTTLRIRMQARFKPKIKKDKEEKAVQKISKKELEEAVGRKLEDEEVRTLKRARREGDYHEKLLDVKVKGKHDKYS